VQEALDWTELCPALAQELEDAVRQLGGIVVPKLNWSCPSDATWLSPFSNMQCAHGDQVGAAASICCLHAGCIQQRPGHRGRAGDDVQ
jgi:hypothetical protein